MWLSLVLEISDGKSIEKDRFTHKVDLTQHPYTYWCENL